ncbi:hypothetical protein [Paenibacillus sp. OV219]|uniref:hypothetical protein n=1 Tax=Paenibacillus sp. OV219 TaxID=1884377 RepID=UPI0008C8FF41|nr:hypothetical protein [Paenibacillus sp. OV219]SEO88238.1 hypothetical protein SAMN05518847_11234 [Paenibacillus sp. OV219]
MKNVKPYAIFALLLPCLIAVDLIMDVLLKLPPSRMLRNFTYPFLMLDPIEKLIMAALIFMFIRKPLYMIVQRMLPGKQTDDGSGATGDESGGGSSGSGTTAAEGAPDQAEQQ